MRFQLPAYTPPDFTSPALRAAPDAPAAVCGKDGVAPDNYHSTSMYPEYCKIGGRWLLAEESRMDCCIVPREGGRLDVVELRNLRQGDRVLLGRGEDGGEGIYLHASGFARQNDAAGDQFAFRQGRSRETAYSRDYDRLYQLLEHEKAHGNIVWVMGPAFAFDFDARGAMQRLIENGYAHALLAGNALGTHDLEAGFLRTALGQNIYTQASVPGGHYNHLDTINAVRRSGSIPRFIEEHGIADGILYALCRRNIPFVLTGSIRDDGPLPEVIASAYEGQAAMRNIIRGATTVICLATQLHTIATGNMTPSFRVREGVVRPVYFYNIDISEFATNKLADRGSLSAIGIVTNAQDFIVNVAKALVTPREPS
jgi:lysine-ketoglutarate reductase/saccharopine dehydrogenase-like protein (TIGR00300 family)